ncbi:hypothetical protein WA158_005331 [Blastocystis sp. Blastoise]
MSEYTFYIEKSVEKPAKETSDVIELKPVNVDEPSSIEKQIIDENDTFCALCGCRGKLICCDGKCKRSFHLECLKLKPSDIPSGEWLCGDCKNDRDISKETISDIFSFDPSELEKKETEHDLLYIQKSYSIYIKSKEHSKLSHSILLTSLHDLSLVGDDMLKHKTQLYIQAILSKITDIYQDIPTSVADISPLNLLNTLELIYQLEDLNCSIPQKTSFIHSLETSIPPFISYYLRLLVYMNQVFFKNIYEEHNQPYICPSLSPIPSIKLYTDKLCFCGYSMDSKCPICLHLPTCSFPILYSYILKFFFLCKQLNIKTEYTFSSIIKMGYKYINLYLFHPPYASIDEHIYLLYTFWYILSQNGHLLFESYYLKPIINWIQKIPIIHYISSAPLLVQSYFYILYTSLSIPIPSSLPSSLFESLDIYTNKYISKYPSPSIPQELHLLYLYTYISMSTVERNYKGYAPLREYRQLLEDTLISYYIYIYIIYYIY